MVTFAKEPRAKVRKEEPSGASLPEAEAASGPWRTRLFARLTWSSFSSFFRSLCGSLGRSRPFMVWLFFLVVFWAALCSVLYGGGWYLWVYFGFAPSLEWFSPFRVRDWFVLISAFQAGSSIHGPSAVVFGLGGVFLIAGGIYWLVGGVLGYLSWGFGPFPSTFQSLFRLLERCWIWVLKAFAWIRSWLLRRGKAEPLELEPGSPAEAAFRRGLDPRGLPGGPPARRSLIPLFKRST